MKAVFFDWGGVLIENPRKNIMGYLAGKLDLPKDKIINFYKKYDVLFQRGEITEEKIFGELCRLEGIKKDFRNSLWKEAFSIVYNPRNEMFDLVRGLRESGYKVGLISNTELPAAEYFMEKHPNEFDSMTFSCRLKVTKPDLKIYLHALKSLKADPYESAFVDNSEENVMAASRLGLVGILYENYEQVRKDLKFFCYLL